MGASPPPFSFLLHSVLPRVPAPLDNEDCYVFALLGGHPNDPGWKSEVADPAAAAMEAAAEKMYGQAFYGVYRAKSAPLNVGHTILRQLGSLWAAARCG